MDNPAIAAQQGSAGGIRACPALVVLAAPNVKGASGMRNITPALAIVLLLGVAAAGPAVIAQAQTATESPAAAPASPPAAAPANPVATAPELQAKDLKGLDAFGSDGQQVGKVVNVNVLADGKVKDAEIRSSGFFGFFASAYVVPADKLSVKGGRVAISLTADEVKKLTK